MRAKVRFVEDLPSRLAEENQLTFEFEQSVAATDGELTKSIQLHSVVHTSDNETVKCLLLELRTPIDRAKVRKFRAAMFLFVSEFFTARAHTLAWDEKFNESLQKLVQQTDKYLYTNHEFERLVAGIRLQFPEHYRVTSDKETPDGRLSWFMQKALSCLTKGQDAWGWLDRGLKGEAARDE